MNNILSFENFNDSDYFSYESICNLWDNFDITLLIDFGETLDKAKMLNKHIESINNILKWINDNRKLISDFLISNDCINLATETVQSYISINENSYKLYTGETISLPISNDDFYKAMVLDTILIDFDEDENRPDTTLHLLFNPDYFNHKSIIVYIDGDKNMEYGGLAG